MDVNRKSKISTYRIWLRLMIKRFLIRPSFLGILLLIPILACIAGRVQNNGIKDVQAAVCVQKGAVDENLEVLYEKLSSLGYPIWEDETLLKKEVMNGHLECGVVIPADIYERLMSNDWHGAIDVYQNNGSVQTQIVKEHVAGILFEIYSEDTYMKTMSVWSADMSKEQEQAYQNFILEAYRTRRSDGSTFQFTYHMDNDVEQNSQWVDVPEQEDTGSVFPVKGILSVLLFISALGGLMEYLRNEAGKVFARIIPKWMTMIVNIWIPLFFTSLVSLPWLVDSQKGIVTGVLNLFLYHILLIVYCGMLSFILRTKEAVYAAVPILTFGSLIGSPVFIRLATYIPIFEIVEKFFPTTYYLQGIVR